MKKKKGAMLDESWGVSNSNRNWRLLSDKIREFMMFWCLLNIIQMAFIIIFIYFFNNSTVITRERGFEHWMSPLETSRGANLLSYKALGHSIGLYL